MTHFHACAPSVPLDAGFCPTCGAPQGSTTNLPTTPGASYKSRAAEGERFLPGTVLHGRYRMTGRLGRGGMRCTGPTT